MMRQLTANQVIGFWMDCVDGASLESAFADSSVQTEATRNTVY